MGQRLKGLGKKGTLPFRFDRTSYEGTNDSSVLLFVDFIHISIFDRALLPASAEGVICVPFDLKSETPWQEDARFSSTISVTAFSPTSASVNVPHASDFVLPEEHTNQTDGMRLVPGLQKGRMNPILKKWMDRVIVPALMRRYLTERDNIAADIGAEG